MSSDSVPDSAASSPWRRDRAHARASQPDRSTGGRRGGLQHPLGMPCSVSTVFGQHPSARALSRCRSSARRGAVPARSTPSRTACGNACGRRNDMGRAKHLWARPGADISVGRLDLLDFLLRRAVLVLLSAGPAPRPWRIASTALAPCTPPPPMIGELTSRCDAAVIGQASWCSFTPPPVSEPQQQCQRRPGIDGGLVVTSLRAVATSFADGRGGEPQC